MKTSLTLLANTRFFRFRLLLLSGMAALFLLISPAVSYASVSYGTDFSYQQNDSVSGSNSSGTAQERFGFYFNLLTAPNSKLTVTGVFRLEVLTNTASAGTTSFELDPDMSFRVATKTTQLGFGYREVNRNDNVIVNSRTQTQTTKSTDIFVDSSFSTGKLPAIRLRYSIRNQNQFTDNVRQSDSETNDFHASMNYKLGIFTLNGDYGEQQGTDKISGSTTDNMTLLLQGAATKRIANTLDLGAREDFNYTQSGNNTQTTAKNYNSTSDLRASFAPFKGAQVAGDYLHRIANDLFNKSETVENTYFASVNYAFPKYLRIYGSYVLHDSSAGQSSSSSDQIVAGMNLSHHVGIFTFNSRYEHRLSSNSSNGGAESSNTQDNFDWLISAHPAKFLNMALSESYVHSSTSAGPSSSSNEFRFITNVGPIKNLALNPYVDYRTSGPSGGPTATATELVVPATYRLSLHQKIALDFANMYRISWSGGSNTATTSTTQDNTVIRIAIARPLPGTNISADATFNTTSGTNTPTTSSSSYSIQGSWSDMPHMLNMNARYQPNSGNSPASMSFATQYGLNLRLKNLSFSLQARYDYSQVFSKDRNNSQGIFVSLNFRK